VFKFSKKNLLKFKHINNTPLLTSNSKGEKIKERVKIKKIQDINGIQITYDIIKKKIKSLFNVNYNNSTKSCNPCMDVAKKVNNKINGRNLSTVSNKEMIKILKDFFVSS